MNNTGEYVYQEEYTSNGTWVHQASLWDDHILKARLFYETKKLSSKSS